MESALLPEERSDDAVRRPSRASDDVLRRCDECGFLLDEAEVVTMEGKRIHPRCVQAARGLYMGPDERADHQEELARERMMRDDGEEYLRWLDR